MQSSHARLPVFDDPNLVSATGLAPVVDLADKAGLTDALATLTIDSPNPVIKARSIIAGMLAGADSIDDLDLLRSGGTARLIGAVRAPSTLGTYLRAFTHGHVLQLAKTNRHILRHSPSPFANTELVLVDVDDTIREVHGYQKQAAAYGYSGIRGLNALVVTASSHGVQPLLLEEQLRRGNIKSGDNAGWHLSRALTTVNHLAPTARALVRADSAFCQYETIAAAIKAGAWWSVTIPQWTTVKRAISHIPDDAWTTIQYPKAIFDEDSGQWISDAEVAEVPDFTAFTSRKKSDHVSCRLIVRRVKRKNEQDAFFDSWRYHAFITNSMLPMVEADQHHRGHAIIEQVISELKNGPLAHLPSGKFAANQAWLAFAAIAYNLAHAAARAAGLASARMQSLRAKLIQVPARLASTGRRLIIHLPAKWPWQEAWARLWNTAASP